jgi:hypothetical protein
MTELEQMTPNQRRALDAGLAALDTMAATWAAEVKLFEIAKHFASISDPDERATRIAAMVRQGFSEGAYRCYLDHKDASAKQAARIAALEAQIATVAPAVDAQPVGVAGSMPGTDGFTMAAFKASEVPVGTPLYASAQSEGLRKDSERYRWLRNDGFVPADFEKQIDAALSQHKAGEKDD